MTITAKEAERAWWPRKRWRIVHFASLLTPQAYPIPRTFWTRSGAESALRHAMRKHPCPEGARAYVERIP